MSNTENNEQVADEAKSTATASQQTQAPQEAPGNIQENLNSVKKSLVNKNDMEFLNDVQISITIEIGRTQIKIRDLLNLTKDSIIDLDKDANEPVDVYANGKLISRGKIITANGKYCVRLMSVTQPVGSA